ncbi:MAG: hypothetical protein KJ064_08000 [Anaerolineae bacterium]|nr:hypothetical protein [Anaerolineae bacterium]
MEQPTNESQQQETELLASIPLPALALCLLWWAFIDPAVYARAKALPDMENRLHRAMSLLVSTLFVAIPAIPLIGLTVGVVPLGERGIEIGFVALHPLSGLVILWLIINLPPYSFRIWERFPVALLEGFIIVALVVCHLAAVALTPNAGNSVMMFALMLVSGFFVMFNGVQVGWKSAPLYLFAALVVVIAIAVLVFGIWTIGLASVIGVSVSMGIIAAAKRQQ